MKKYLTRDGVLRLTKLSQSTMYRLRSEGKFPTPFRVGRKLVRWDSEDILGWMADQERYERFKQKNKSNQSLESLTFRIMDLLKRELAQ